MSRVLQIALGVAAAMAMSGTCEAGVLADDLSRCLVTKASDSDNAAIMAWMFSAISSDSKLQKYTTLDRKKRDELATNAGNVFQAYSPSIATNRRWLP